MVYHHNHLPLYTHLEQAYITVPGVYKAIYTEKRFIIPLITPLVSPSDALYY